MSFVDVDQMAARSQSAVTTQTQSSSLQLCLLYHSHPITQGSPHLLCSPFPSSITSSTAGSHKQWLLVVTLTDAITTGPTSAPHHPRARQPGLLQVDMNAQHSRQSWWPQPPECLLQQENGLGCGQNRRTKGQL